MPVGFHGSVMNAWLALAASSALQVGWLVSLRQLDGLRRPAPLLLYAVFGLASTYLLSRSLQKIPMGTAYAVWTGLSVVGSIAVDSFAGRGLGGPVRIACILLIVAAAAGLQLTAAPAR